MPDDPRKLRQDLFRLHQVLQLVTDDQAIEAIEDVIREVERRMAALRPRVVTFAHGKVSH